MSQFGVTGIGARRGELTEEQQRKARECAAAGTLDALIAAADLLRSWGFEPPASGQRALAEATLRRIAGERRPRASCAAVALIVVGPFHQIMREVASGEIGTHYQDEVPQLLARLPSDENLRELADGETKFWNTARGSWFGALISADSRYNLLREARQRHYPDWDQEPDEESGATSTADAEGATMKKGGGDAAAGGGIVETVGQVLDAAERVLDVPTKLANAVEAVCTIKSKVAGSYDIQGADTGDEFGTVPDGGELDRVFERQVTRYSVIMKSTCQLQGALEEQDRRINLNTALDVVLDLGFSYEWGLKCDTGQYPCLHVRRFRLTHVRMSYPSFTDLSADYRITTINPTSDRPVAGIRLRLKLDVTPSVASATFHGTCRGTLDFYGDGTIESEMDGCVTRPAILNVTDSPEDRERILDELAREREERRAEAERLERDLAVEAAREAAARREDDRLKERFYEAGNPF